MIIPSLYCYTLRITSFSASCPGIFELYHDYKIEGMTTATQSCTCFITSTWIIMITALLASISLMNYDRLINHVLRRWWYTQAKKWGNCLGENMSEHYEMSYETFEDTKGIIKCRKSKEDRQHNRQRKTDKQSSTNSMKKIKDWVTRILLKSGGKNWVIRKDQQFLLH